MTTRDHGAVRAIPTNQTSIKVVPIVLRSRKVGYVGEKEKRSIHFARKKKIPLCE